jgi:energy-converting hydrogenase B subunit D
MMAWIVLLLVALMLGAAVLVLMFDNLVAAIAAASVVSLLLSLLFALLAAPDVALTEAAVGAGLSGAVLALGLRRLGLIDLGKTEKDRHA